MATLNLTSTITSSGLTSDVISSTVLKTATVDVGGITRENITATSAGSANILFTAADWTPTATKSVYVYVKNAHTSNWVKLIFTTTDTQHEMYIAAGQWALFPWTGSVGPGGVNIEAFASANPTLIEYGVFF